MVMPWPLWFTGPLSLSCSCEKLWACTIPYQIHIGSGAGDDLTPGTWHDPGNLCATPSEI